MNASKATVDLPPVKLNIITDCCLLMLLNKLCIHVDVRIGKQIAECALIMGKKLFSLQGLSYLQQFSGVAIQAVRTVPPVHSLSQPSYHGNRREREIQNSYSKGILKKG